MSILAGIVFVLSCLLMSAAGGSLRKRKLAPVGKAGYKRSPFGHFINFIAGNWFMPFVAIGVVLFFVVQVFGYYGENSKGVEFFVETEPEQVIVFVRARTRRLRIFPEFGQNCCKRMWDRPPASPLTFASLVQIGTTF